MKIYLAVTTAKKPKVIIADFSYETCAKLGKIYSRNRKFKVVERYFPFDDNESVSRLMEGALLSRIDFITSEANAHLHDEVEPMKVYLPDEFIEHMSTVKKETRQ